MTPAAFIFDLDGTLLDTNRLNFQIWCDLITERGQQFTEELYLSFIGRKRTETERILTEHYGKDFPFQELLKLRIERAAKSMEQTGAPLKKGAAELVKSMCEKGYPIGLVTSTPHKEACELLERAGLFRFFFAVVGGDEVAEGKPNPEGYLECARRLGCVPEACLVFEDIDLGAHAANNAGMKVILVPDMVRPGEDVRRVAWAVLNGLDEVERFMGVCWG